MAAPDHKKRFSEAQALLDYGFANCSIYKDPDIAGALEEVPVQGGTKTTAKTAPKMAFSHTFTSETDPDLITKKITYAENIKAPLEQGAVVGTVEYFYDNNSIGSIEIVAAEPVGEAGFTDYFMDALRKLFHKM